MNRTHDNNRLVKTYKTSMSQRMLEISKSKCMRKVLIQNWVSFIVPGNVVVHVSGFGCVDEVQDFVESTKSREVR